MAKRISGLNPTALPNRLHEVWAERNLVDVRLRIEQILGLITDADLAGKMAAPAVSFDPGTAGPLTATDVAAALAEIADGYLRPDRADAPLLPVPGGRLTLESGAPVPTGDLTNQSTIYYTPHIHNAVYLYDGSKWKRHFFTERSLSLAGKTAGVYDVFLYDNAGTLTLDLVAWSTTSARATALARQNGVWTLNGTPAKLYLGTIYLHGTAQCHDLPAFRNVWNAYHRVTRSVRIFDGTATWTYATATIRAFRGISASNIEFVVGLPDTDALNVNVVITAQSSAGTLRNYNFGVGLDTSTAFTRSKFIQVNSGIALCASLPYSPSAMTIGKHNLYGLEQAAGGDTQTVYGSGGGTGIEGTLHA